MKTLIVFYSKTGNTKKIAEILAKKLNADVDQIIDHKNRNGFLNSIISCFDALNQKTTSISVSKNPKDYDLVIIGSPVWAGRFTPAFLSYLKNYSSSLKKVIIFSTSGQDHPQIQLDQLSSNLNINLGNYFYFTSTDLSNQSIVTEKINQLLASVY